LVEEGDKGGEGGRTSSPEEEEAVDGSRTEGERAGTIEDG